MALSIQQQRRINKMIFITSIPKSGTHLLATVIEQATGEYPVSVKKYGLDENSNLSKYQDIKGLIGHFRVAQLESNESLKYHFAKRKIIILIRDPRDICNSMLHYLERSVNSHHKNVASLLEHMDYDSKIKAVASGLISSDKSFKVANLTQLCSGFIEIQHLFPEQTTIIKYEDFFTENIARDKIAKFLDIDQQSAERYIQNALSSETKTKNIGLPYAWKKNFNDHLKSFINESHSDIIRQLGYEV